MMSNISAEVLTHSVGPNGKEICTFLLQYPRFIHSEHLRHRTQSFSVASSRAIPAAKLMKQVKENPAMPIHWPKQHKGMQGTEVFELTEYHSEHDATSEGDGIRADWLEARDNAVQAAEDLSHFGLSKQLTNRLIEPWVTTRCVCTATEWDGFFELRHPHYNATHNCPKCGLMCVHNGKCYTCGNTEGLAPISPDAEPIKIWASEPDLNFPAEYNIQQLAICMKKAMDESTPQKLEAGQWHLPFISHQDAREVAKMLPKDYEEKTLGILNPDQIPVRWDIIANDQEMVDTLIKVSAARAAYTSYDHNGKGAEGIEKDLALAERLIPGNHWSPFEHQAMAIEESDLIWDASYGDDRESDFHPCRLNAEINWETLPKGTEIRFSHEKEYGELWSRNFQGYVQARATLDS